MKEVIKPIIKPIDDSQFYDLFHKDYLPSYDFFRLFFSKLAKAGITIVKYSTLYDFIRKMKKEDKYNKLLQDIRFSYNGINYVSKDIESNLNTLQTLGALGRSNPSYELLLNYFSSESSDEILNSYKEYGELLEELVDDYRKFSYS